ncbi:VOC family protein [Saccharibacillus alkalitolerans]|uniref:VOC family protein n=1 Tax=Saccharibacillus alkalitolerans TaxID=2705290 RepID=A0ABX0FBB9_9BACL|nr:VOC family protein [Saccharibacillus alkalitolerans]NGZ77665.1 VOC family protein [Saccharibacillus alkalitolerans]
MSDSLSNQVRGVFIPVRDIERARDWYCRLLGLPADGEILFGHIYVLPMQSGVNLVLDSKIYAPEHVHKVAAVQLASGNIRHSRDVVRALGIEPVTEIENGHWFNIQDPDGNVLMICQ